LRGRGPTAEKRSLAQAERPWNKEYPAVFSIQTTCSGLPLSVRYYQQILVQNYRKAFNMCALRLSLDGSMEKDGGEGISEGDVERVYLYLVSYGRLGAHPYQIAKAVNLGEHNVMQAIESLRREGKVRVRSTNVEWKSRHTIRSHTVRPQLDANDTDPEIQRTPL
jgi:hypothetical protein